MPRKTIGEIEFGKVYPLYVQKAERKGRTKAEVDQVIRWLTGYDEAGLERQIASGNDFQAFFDQAPALNPNREQITGMICGYRVEEIEDPIARKGRQLDSWSTSWPRARRWRKCCGSDLQRGQRPLVGGK